jgi:hypothetical protein
MPSLFAMSWVVLLWLAGAGFGSETFNEGAGTSAGKRQEKERRERNQDVPKCGSLA